MGNSSLLQWGHNFTVVEIAVDAWMFSPGHAGFNGATTLQLWKLKFFGFFRVLSSWLQWGHNFTVVEISIKRGGSFRWTFASMGPQLYSCGNDTTEYDSNMSDLSFNGATTLQLWKCGYGTYITTVSKSFNGATTLQLWKSHAVRKQVFIILDASMGPQLYSCGNHH